MGHPTTGCRVPRLGSPGQSPSLCLSAPRGFSPLPKSSPVWEAGEGRRDQSVGQHLDCSRGKNQAPEPHPSQRWRCPAVATSSFPSHRTPQPGHTAVPCDLGRTSCQGTAAQCPRREPLTAAVGCPLPTPGQGGRSSFTAAMRAVLAGERQLGPRGLGKQRKAGCCVRRRLTAKGSATFGKRAAPGPSSPGWLSRCRGTAYPQTAGDTRRTKVSKLSQEWLHAEHFTHLVFQHPHPVLEARRCPIPISQVKSLRPAERPGHLPTDTSARLRGRSPPHPPVSPCSLSVSPRCLPSPFGLLLFGLIGK